MNMLRGAICARYKTEAACARALGWRRQKLNYITNRRRMPDVRDVNDLAKALSIDVAVLIDFFLNAESTNE